MGNSLSIQNKLEVYEKLNQAKKKLQEINKNKVLCCFPYEEEKNSDINQLNSQYYEEKNEMKKYNLNILYYDENLRDKGENSDNCTFFDLNINGTFYGCHYFELFKIVCEKK